MESFRMLKLKLIKHDWFQNLIVKINPLSKIKEKT